MSPTSPTGIADFLASLDRERRAAGVPSGHGTVREFAADGSQCRIVYSHCAAAEVDEVIRAETGLARSAGYPLEWKVYPHDPPPDLPDRLCRAGFRPDDEECVLALALTGPALARLGPPVGEVRRVSGAAGLADVAAIARDIGRRDADAERGRLAAALRDTPDRLSIHVAYVDGVPAASGRVHYRPGGPAAELAGGRTRPDFRHRGLFTALVAARLREARARGRTHAFVDALPTSEPILRRRGFVLVTRTRPYVYQPST